MENSFGWFIIFGVIYLFIARRGRSCRLPFQKRESNEQNNWESLFCCLTPVEEETLAKQALPGGIAVLMFTDLEGFTTYVDQHGDDVAYDMLKQHQRLIEANIQQFGGNLIKTIGDGTLVSFASARNALKCAAAIQQDMAESTAPLRLRIGLHAGEPIHNEEQDLIGHTVNVTERVMSQAAGSQIFVTDVVKNLAGEMKGYQFSELGEQCLKGISTPQRMYEFQEIASLSHPLDSVLDERLKALESNLN